MSEGKILSTAKTKSLARILRAKLSSLGDVDILLVSPDLDEDPQRNNLLKRGLDALAREKLILVQVDDAPLPLGLRDIVSFRWSSETSDKDGLIEQIAQALRLAKMRASKARARPRADLFWPIFGVVVAVMLVVLFVRNAADFLQDAAYRTQLEEELGGASRAAAWRSYEGLVQAIFWMVAGVLALQILSLSTGVARWGLRRLARSKGGKQVQTETAGGLLFASYSRQDHEKVDAMIADIEHDGLPVWLDRVNISGGATWPEAIVQAIKGARGIIVFCSHHSLGSDNVLREVNLAAEFKKPILPVLLEPVQVPDSFHYYLSTRQIIDASADPNWRLNVLAALRHGERR